MLVQPSYTESASKPFGDKKTGNSNVNKTKDKKKKQEKAFRCVDFTVEEGERANAH